jgi:hypothetical protein
LLKFNNNQERVDYALERAIESFDLLSKAEVIVYEKMAWEAFLTSVDGIRQSLIDSYKGNRQHNDWYSKFSADMKNDDLLVYMRNARNNAQHIVTKTPLDNQFGFNIFDKNGKTFPMDSISSTFKDGNLTISLESKDLPDDIELDADFYRLNATAMTVTNNGKKYPPPSIHQGVLLFSVKIHHLAEVTLEYYKSVIKKIDKLNNEII